MNKNIFEIKNYVRLVHFNLTVKKMGPFCVNCQIFFCVTRTQKNPFATIYKLSYKHMNKNIFEIKNYIGLVHFKFTVKKNGSF